MAVEIERKFLVDKKSWNAIKPQQGIRIIQGYLSKSEVTVRVRVKGEKGFITIKGKTVGISRTEYEYEIPKLEAEEMLNKFCPKKIDKIRYEVFHHKQLWEVDEFSEPNQGLILAEIELESEDEEVVLPNWIEQEVTGQKEYYNSFMVDQS